jgi:glutathione synthase/RimK-type ligase-like ATP-grasp enzyme
MRSHVDWVFCVYNLTPYPNIIKEQSIAAVKALGLDFGGVDISIDKEGHACVFEVNTAPWINRESTWSAYRNAFTQNFSD